jgi:hypothetical protein
MNIIRGWQSGGGCRHVRQAPKPVQESSLLRRVYFGFHPFGIAGSIIAYVGLVACHGSMNGK